MGSKYEVTIWVYDEVSMTGKEKRFWAGESFIAALWNMRKAKKTGSGCISLLWRGKTP